MTAAIHSSAVVHTTARVEAGVAIGARTTVWDHVHLRGPGTTVGCDCIIGEKTYLAPGVVVGDLVKLNAMVYLPTGVVLDRGVMVGAGTVFTNDRYPRATDPDLVALQTSEPGADTLNTFVGAGATIGAGCTIGCGLAIGRFAMVGMGSVVTRDVPDHHLVVGNPARSIAIVCRCGEPIRRLAAGARNAITAGELACPRCARRYDARGGTVTEL